MALAGETLAVGPDAWVRRDARLIPLTGPHPYNAEPPTTLLMEKGFVTPNSLHYVRNHGKVPIMEWNAHKLSVEGLVSQPREWTMDQLTTLPPITVNVTLSCDGNRRKEVNTIQRGRGFDWGSGGIGTAAWTGVLLHQLLRKCGEFDTKARYVQFEGADELPKGKYATSIPLHRAMDPLNEIIVAFRMNGDVLPPDHGFPLRMILPGFVGGRSVKWLTKIIVSEKESESHYHTHDNKVLPPWVSPDIADTDPVWKKPELTLYDLNVNSVIVYPEHESWVDDPLTKEKPNMDTCIKGFAYAGGGRRITRVELTTDNGKIWIPAEITYPDSSSSSLHGRVWTWCHWEATITKWKLLKISEIAVRAFDEASNTQPENITWNVLGMMNNAWYRVKIDVEDTSWGPRVTFHHPVLPGLLEGGWRVEPPSDLHRVEWNSKVPLALPTTSVAAARAGRQFSRAEIIKHNTVDDCWIIINQEVFDITPYIKAHPGGPDSLRLIAGRDASELFGSIHAHDAHTIKDMYCIGVVVGKDDTELIPISPPVRDLDVRRWLKARLLSRKDEAKDVRRFVFQLETADEHDAKIIGLPTGLHVLIGMDVQGEFVVRPYTPTSPGTKEEDHGQLEFVIRIYGKGRLTPALDKLAVGDRVSVKGPMGVVMYLGDGAFSVHGSTRQVRSVNLLGGGTGITPLYQVMRASLLDPNDMTVFYLVYANRSVEDTLLRKELEDLAQRYPSRANIWFTVSQPPKDRESWKYDVGLINEEMMRKHLAYPPTKEAICLFCGPPPMIEAAAMPFMEKIGYVPHQEDEF